MNELVHDNLTQNPEKFKNMDKKNIEQTLLALKDNKQIADDIIVEALHASIEKYGKWQSVKVCLIEGFPRNLQQAKSWDVKVC